jgi:hypothetical protein
LQRYITGVKANEATVMDKKTKKVDVLPFGGALHVESC